MIQRTRTSRAQPAEAAQVFRQFAWNVAGAIAAPKAGREAAPRNRGPARQTPERG